MSAVEGMVEANGRYAEDFDKGDLSMPPAPQVAIVTCMDARLHPAKFLGLELGDAHVIRNAGGRVSDDALRSKLGPDAEGIDFLPFSDNEQSVREDVEKVRSSPLIPEGTPVSGYIYDVATGRLEQVVEPG